MSKSAANTLSLFQRTPSSSSSSKGKSKSKPLAVGPKQKKNAVKARKAPHELDVARRLRVTKAHEKAATGTRKLDGYFSATPDKTPCTVPVSSDSASDDWADIANCARIGRPSEASKYKVDRFIIDEAECSEQDSLHTDEEEDPTAGGFIVSDGHLSSEEGSPHWDIGPPPSLHPSPILIEDSEPEEPLAQVESGGKLELSESDSSMEEDDPEEPEMEEPGVEVGPSAGKFRLNNQMVFLTYKTWLPKAHYIEWLKTHFNRPDAWVRLAHETGDKKMPYKHTHVVVDFAKRVQVYDAHKFCYKNPEFPKVDKCGAIHPNIKKLLHQKALVDAKIYIAKEDRDNKDLLALKKKDGIAGANLVEKIQTSTSINQALRTNLKRISDAPGIIQVFGKRNLWARDLTIPPRPDRPWHRELMAEVEKKNCPEGDRKVIWYVDSIGGTGKSHFAKYMSRTYRDESGYDWLCLSALDEPKEAYNQLMQALESGFRYKGFIVDVARGHKFKRGLYTYLETFKNGQLTATKYQGGCLEFNTPWVIVLSNFWPKTEMMSRDRWDIRKISSETHEAEKVAYDSEQPENFRHCASCTCGGNYHHQILQEQK